MAGVAGSPVDLHAERLNEVPQNGYGLAPYFVTLSLWVGALAFYLMMPAVSDRILKGRQPAWLVGPASFVPGALMAVVQSLLMMLIIRFGLGIEPANFWGLLAVVTLTSLTFVAINQAFIALIDAPGRFLALIFNVLQLSAAGGTYPIQTSPDFFGAIHGWLPLSYAVGAFRSLIAGGDLGVAPAVSVLLTWLVICLALTSLGIWRRPRAAAAVGEVQAVPA